MKKVYDKTFFIIIDTEIYWFLFKQVNCYLAIIEKYACAPNTLWGYIKSNVYYKLLKTIENMQERTHNACLQFIALHILPLEELKCVLR